MGMGRGDLSRQAANAAAKAAKAVGKPVTTDDIRKQERRIAKEWRAFSDDNYSRTRRRS